MHSNLPPTRGDHLKLPFVARVHCDGDTEPPVNSPIKAKVVLLDIRKGTYEEVELSPHGVFCRRAIYGIIH